MAVISFPSITPEMQQFGIQYNTQVSSSPISGVSQTVELPGARWAGNIGFTDMTASESAALKAFLLRLRGSAGRFYYGDKSHTEPFLNVTSGGSVTSSTGRRHIKCTTTGQPFSVGDYIQIGNDENRELKMIIAASQDTGLTYDYTVEPFIRRTTYVGQNIYYDNPTGVFMLTSSDQARWAVRSKALLSDINLDFIEVYS